MGAGVGTFVRIAVNLEEYKSFVEFRYYSAPYLRYLHKRLKYKFRLKYKVFV
jgi:hypothetical protein